MTEFHTPQLPKTALEAGFTNPAEQLAYYEGFQLGQHAAQLAMAMNQEISHRNDKVREPMTKLLNREGLKTALELWGEHSEDKLIIAFDCRKFKSVNDTYGHAAGDTTIHAIADVLRGSFRTAEPNKEYPKREPDFLAQVARVGGDEFIAAILVNPEYSIERHLQSIEGRLTARMEDLYNAQAANGLPLKELGFGLTIGAAVWKHDEPLAEVLEKADQRLIENKEEQAAGRVPQVSGILYRED